MGKETRQGFRFRPSQHLRKGKDIAETSLRGKRMFSRHFVIFFKENEQGEEPKGLRLGLTVSKKVSKRAVVRNRVKRLLREWFRLSQSQLPPDFDILIIARKNSEQLSFQELHKEIMACLRYHQMLRQIPRPGEANPSGDESKKKIPSRKTENEDSKNTL